MREPLADPELERRHYKTHKRLVNVIFQHFNDYLPPDANASTHPFHYLVYWHIRMLAYLCAPDPYSQSLLEACSGSTNVLVIAGKTNTVTPLNHHFTSLTAMLLLELSRVEDSRKDALKLLKEIADNSIPPSPYDGPIKDKILERLRPATTGSINSQNLQHLAELAAAADEVPDAGDVPDAPEADGASGPGNAAVPANYEELGFDPRPLLVTGYLNYFNSNPNNE